VRAVLEHPRARRLVRVLLQPHLVRVRVRHGVRVRHRARAWAAVGRFSSPTSVKIASTLTLCLTLCLTHLGEDCLDLISPLDLP